MSRKLLDTLEMMLSFLALKAVHLLQYVFYEMKLCRVMCVESTLVGKAPDMPEELHHPPVGSCCILREAKYQITVNR